MQNELQGLMLTLDDYFMNDSEHGFSFIQNHGGVQYRLSDHQNQYQHRRDKPTGLGRNLVEVEDGSIGVGRASTLVKAC